MMFAAIAPSMNNAYAGNGILEFCMLAGPTWTGIGVVEDGITLVKCFDTQDPCFAEGVPVKSDESTTCTILVLMINTSGQNVILKDAIPAEWSAEVRLLSDGTPDASDNCDDNLAQANKGKKEDKSATLFTCDATTFDGFVGAFLDITTRESPGKGHKEDVFKPTSCDGLFANSGAQVIAADDEGNPILVPDGLGGFEPIVLAETGPLEVQVIGEECEEPLLG